MGKRSLHVMGFGGGDLEGGGVWLFF